MKKLAACLIAAGVTLGSASAFAGEWRLDTRRCPDLVEDHFDRREDRRDSRVDYSRRDRAEDRYDRRENRRDERITVCPRSAFVYVADRNDHRYGARNHGRRYERRPALKLSFDRRVGLPYRFENGRRIYVRG